MALLAGADDETRRQVLEVVQALFLASFLRRRASKWQEIILPVMQEGQILEANASENAFGRVRHGLQRRVH